MGFMGFLLYAINNPKFWEFLIACLIVAILAGLPYGKKSEK